MCAMHPLHGRIRAHACVKGHSHAHGILSGRSLDGGMGGRVLSFSRAKTARPTVNRGGVASSRRPDAGAAGSVRRIATCLPHKGTLPTAWAALCARRAVDRCQVSARVPWMPSRGSNVGAVLRVSTGCIVCYTLLHICVTCCACNSPRY